MFERLFMAPPQWVLAFAAIIVGFLAFDLESLANKMHRIIIVFIGVHCGSVLVDAVLNIHLSSTIFTIALSI